MPVSFDTNFSPNFKATGAGHRMWQVFCIANGDSWPRIVPNTITDASSFYRLGIIPAFTLTAPTTTSTGTSTAGTYGVCLVYRSSLFFDGLTAEDIQSNRSNIVDVTLGSSDAAVLTKITTTDGKVNNLDVYAAQKIGSTYGTFYRVVKDGANTAGTITFNIQMSNGQTVGAGVTGGTADNTGLVLATDNDFPQAQPILLEVNGRLVALGGLNKRLTCTFVNGSSTITTSETIYDGIEFWNFQRDGDTTGGINGRGTYLVRYATANTLTIVNIDGTTGSYSGASGSDLSTCWTEPNRKYSKALNPHAFPADNINNDYYSAILAAGKMPNTNRVLIMGKDWVVAEDYDRLPIQSGLNYISTEYGCSSHFSIVAAHGRLYWLDFGKGKREIIVSDGSTCQPISTKKIKTVLESLTLDTNGDPWRVGFIHGAYFQREDTIRWGIYLNNNSLANYVLELDLTSGDLKNDPIYYPHRFLDVFTYGSIRGNTFIGQYGWSGGIARIGIDNVTGRYLDWVASGTISGTLDDSGQTTTILTDTDAEFQVTGDALAGMPVVIWRETDANGDLVIDPTYYQCRISDNSETTLTINYVETCNAIGQVQSVDVTLPETPDGEGWQYMVGGIQGIIGPKWFTSSDAKTDITFRELAISHEGYDTQTATKLKVHGHENFDNQPRDAQYAEAVQEGQQVADTNLNGHSRAIPKTNPCPILGFTVVDNNVSFDPTSLSIELFVVDTNEQIDQDDAAKSK